MTSIKSCGKRHRFCRVCDPERGVRHGKALKGRPLSPAHCAAISRGLTGKILTDAHRSNVSQGSKGKSISPAHRAAISQALKGIRKGPAHCAGIRRGLRSLFTGPLGPARRKKLAVRVVKQMAEGRIPNVQSKLERIMLIFLHEAGFHVLAQRKFGRYCVDAYLPDEGIVFEADGAYWHARREKERPGYRARRDQYLKSLGLAIVHLTEGELLRQIAPLMKLVDEAR